MLCKKRGVLAGGRCWFPAALALPIFFFPTGIEVKLSNKHKVLLYSQFCLIFTLRRHMLSQSAVSSCSPLFPALIPSAWQTQCGCSDIELLIPFIPGSDAEQEYNDRGFVMAFRRQNEVAGRKQQPRARCPSFVLLLALCSIKVSVWSCSFPPLVGHVS